MFVGAVLTRTKELRWRDGSGLLNTCSWKEPVLEPSLRHSVPIARIHPPLQCPGHSIPGGGGDLTWARRCLWAVEAPTVGKTPGCGPGAFKCQGVACCAVVSPSNHNSTWHQSVVCCILLKFYKSALTFREHQCQISSWVLLSNLCPSLLLEQIAFTQPPRYSDEVLHQHWQLTTVWWWGSS